MHEVAESAVGWIAPVSDLLGFRFAIQPLCRERRDPLQDGELYANCFPIWIPVVRLNAGFQT
jgi:hypothetical protein